MFRSFLLHFPSFVSFSLFFSVPKFVLAIRAPDLARSGWKAFAFKANHVDPISKQHSLILTGVKHAYFYLDVDRLTVNFDLLSFSLSNFVLPAKWANCCAGSGQVNQLPTLCRACRVSAKNLLFSKISASKHSFLCRVDKLISHHHPFCKDY